ncbi:MAG: TonB-dependent receptor [Gammaproteobacteria bacterium]|nr:TonB-dependent receptor [Gammaproteobacteria bacterium]
MKPRTRFPLIATLLFALPLSPAVAQDQNQDEFESVLEEVVVTGIRSSLRNAELIKSEARNIVEAITPEDLGKFVDDSIAESLQRLPGVQVEQDYVGSRGDQVSIRGLGPQFVVATVNGRTAWSSGSGEGFHLRSYNFSVIPSEVVNEVLVTKTPLADTVESGLGGAVDVRTLRPLDAKFEERNWLGRLDARAEMVDVGESNWGPRLSGILASKNDAGTVGAYLAFNWSDIEGGRDRQQVRYRTSRTLYVDHNNNFIADDDEKYAKGDITTMRDVLYSPDRWDLKRSGLAGALEFRPSDELSIVADILYTTFERENNRPNVRFDFDTPFKDDINKDDMLFAPDGIIIEEGGVGDNIYHTTFMDSNGFRCMDGDVQIQGPECGRKSARALSMRNQVRNNFTDTMVGGLNLNWNRDNWNVNGDLFWNDLDAVVLEASMDANNSNLDNPLVLDITGNGPPQSGVAQSDLDLNRYSPRRLRIRQRSTQGDQVGARLDFNVDVANDNVESVQFGARYNSSDIDYSASQRASWDDGGFDDDAFFNAFYTDQYFDPVDGVALPVVNFQDSLEYLGAVNLLADIEGGSEFGPCTTGNVRDYMKFSGRFNPRLTKTCEDLRQSFYVEEETYSAYGAINFEGNWGSVPVFTNLGLRYVKTENKSSGVVSMDIGDTELPPDPNETITTSGKFSKLLPNLNMRFDLSETVQLRFSAAETLSRPEVYDLTSRFKISVSDDDDSGDITPEDCEGGGCVIKKGNPNLDPYTAWNYDLTLMWAMPGDGFLATSIFYKDIEGFIFDSVSGPVTLPEYGDAQFYVEQPTNAENAKVAGFEIAIHQPFTFLQAPWDGLGVQLNYSYVDSEFSAGTDAYDSGEYGLPGSSPNNLNAILYFETKRFGIRLSYIYRDDYFSSFGGGAFDGVDRYVKANENLSVNLSYDITDSLQFIAKATNLTDSIQEEFITYDSLMQSYYTRPRTYSLGLRWAF